MHVKRSPLLFALLAAIGICGPANALVVQGAARVVDGDTLDVAGTRVRLYGIDAPELAQICRRGENVSWQCGRAAADHLRRLTAGRNVSCEGSERDALARLIAVCRITPAGPSVNEQMVSAGMAWAFTRYSSAYVGTERRAREMERGVFAGESQPPWEFRAARWVTPVGAPPDASCPIKGNITRRGERIYHMPWDTHYARTSIDVRRGERWFCDEAEAVNGGWRRARG